MDNGHRRMQWGTPLVFCAMLCGFLVTAAGFSISDAAWLRDLLILVGLVISVSGGLALFLHRRWNHPPTLSMPGNLAENEERLRLALEGAGLAIWDWDIPSGEQIVSPEWFGMLGYAPDEVGGDFESWKRLVHPADLPGVLAVIDDHLHNRLPFYEVEYRLKTHSGDWKWVLARGRVVVRGPAGQPLRMAGTHRDISGRKEMEARLQAQEERQKSILASMREAVWSFNPDFSKLQYVNAAVEGIYGRPVQDFFDQSDLWLRLIHPDDRLSVAAACQTLAQNDRDEMSYRILLPDGQIRWVRSSATMVRDSYGKPLRVDGITLDITEHKQADEALSHRDAILNAISTTAERLLSTASWHEVLPEMLSNLGQAIQASRAYVFEVYEQQPGEMAARPVGEWTAPGFRPEAFPREPGASPLSSGAMAPISSEASPRKWVFQQSGFGRWQEILSAGQILQGNVTSFPKSEQPYLRKLDIRSLITVPIHTGSGWWGFMGFDDCQAERSWLVVEVDALKVAANVLAAAIQRQLMFEAEREERRVAEELRGIAVVFSQSLNYDSILDRLLEQAPRIVPYDHACVMLVRGDHAYIARERGDERVKPEISPHSSPEKMGASPFSSGALARSFEISQTPNLRRLLETRQPAIIPDTLFDPDWIPLEGYGFRAWAGAPLILGGQVDAILSLVKLEPGFYTQVHAARLSLFSGQASLALRNAQLFAETLEALEHEQHLGEITRAISSELDLPIILQHVVRLAVELAEADAGSMAILDDETQSLSYPYLYNLPQELSLEMETPETGIAWETIYHRQSQMWDDYAALPRANPRWVAAGIHGIIGVPVIAGNTCLGGLSVISYDPEHHFGARDLSLVELVGRQAGVAIQNARLFESAQHRAAEAETLRQAASAVNSALALDEVLNKILEQLETVIPYDSAAIFLVEEDHIQMKAGRGLANLDELMGRKYPGDDQLFQTVEASRLPVILDDAQADPRFEHWGKFSEIHGWIGLALRVREEKIGFLTIDSHQAGAYRMSDGELAQAFADEVAIAIENARLFEQVQRLAITDPLTGLYNRRYFFEAARREFERARRYNSPLAVIMIDLDHFKQVNDNYGHLAGDRVLVAVAVRSRQSLREVDVLARYGGEEFIFLLPQTGIEGASLLADRLRASIMVQPVDSGSQHISVSACIGLAEIDPTCPDVQALIHRADQALYVAKHAGKGKISVWEEQAKSN